MLTKINKMKTSSVVTVKPFSLLIFFYFTQHHLQIEGKLIPFLRQYNLSFERFKGKGSSPFKKNIPLFYKNANFVAWSHAPLSQQDYIFLSQFLLSQVNVLAFFFEGHLWTPSRLKRIQTSFSDSTKTYPANISSFNIFWKSFYQGIV